MNETRRIYVMLTDTGTLFTNMIKMVTKAPMNHASIALDPELREVYSFGRKDPANPWAGGFIKEDVNGPLFKRATCAMYSVTVSVRTFERMIDGFAPALDITPSARPEPQGSAGSSYVRG